MSEQQGARWHPGGTDTREATRLSLGYVIIPDMPTRGSLAREDQAIDDLVAHLQGAGSSAVLVGRPDRESGNPLSVDAVIRIDGESWAIDVCSLAHAATFPVAHERARTVLMRELDPIAAAHGVRIAVTCRALDGQPGESWGADYYAHIVAEVARLAVLGPAEDFTVIGDGTYVWIRAQNDADAGEQPEDVSIQIWLGQSPEIAKEVERDLAAPLAKKLSGQLAAAKAAGLKIGLLLDAVAPQDTGNWRHFEAGEISVTQALATLNAEARGLEAAWFCHASGKLTRVL